MSDVMAWLAVGAVVGWLAGQLLRARKGLLATHLLLGMAGALMAGWWGLPWLSWQQELAGVEALAVVSLGAAGVLLLVNLVPTLFLRRRRLR